MRGMLVGLLLIVSACSSGSGGPGPDRVQTLSAEPRGSLYCAASATPVQSLPVPEGTERARLCAYGSTPWRAPQEVLNAGDGVLRVVDAINALEPRDASQGYCFAVGGAGFTILLGQAVGRATFVTGHTGGCGTVEIGGVQYADAKGLLQRFLSEIEAQRADRKPKPGQANAPLDCNALGQTIGLSPSLTGRFTDGVRAVSCWFPHSEQTTRWRQVSVMPSELRILLQDLRRRGARKQGDYTRPLCDGRKNGTYNQQLLVQTQWGDVIATQSVCEEYMVSDGAFWRPGSRALRLLASLRASAR